MILVGKNFEERGLSAAVAPDQADFFSSGDGEGDAVEEGLVAVGKAEFVGGEEGGHGGKKGESEVRDRKRETREEGGEVEY